jgi:hypothetical protein
MTLFRVNIKATDPGLDSGVCVLEPTAGEILRDVWWEIVTAWNSSGPALADVGQFVNGYSHGIYGAAANGPVDVTLADTQPGGAGDVLIGATENDLQVAGSFPTPALRPAPSRFTSDAPLLVVVSKDGTSTNAPGAQAAVDAAGAPTFAAAVAAHVTATNTPDFGSATDAFVVANQAARVGKVAIDNNQFYFGAPGSEVLYTVPIDTYATLADLEAAMLDATGGSGAFGDFVTLTDDGTTITATAKTPGTSMNGWDFLAGPAGRDFLHFAINPAYAAPGFASGQALAGGADAPGLVVTTGVNDTFKYGAVGSELVYTVAPGTYTTLAEIEAAMSAALDSSSAPLSAVVTLTDNGTELVATAVVGGSSYNGWDFVTGWNDFLAASGFANGQALAGGDDGELVVVAGVNDTFQFGAPGSEVTYTVAPGSYTSLFEVATAMSAALDSSSAPLSAVVLVGALAFVLYAQAVAVGSSYNGWDFLAGTTDFLAASGFTAGQALEGGEDPGGGGPTGATEGELNLYLEIEACYPPAPWYAPTKPDVPAFPWAGQV